jgi:type IX secretion system PorP/SprF family membrane protein
MKATSIFILLFFISLGIHAQDILFNQPLYAPTCLSPALTGSNQGLRLSMVNQNQWFNTPTDKGVGFNTQYIGVDTRESCHPLGLGMHVLRNNRGEGSLETVKLGLDLSVHVQIGARARSGVKKELTAGISSTMNYEALNWSNLIFSSQLDPVLGKIYAANGQKQGIETNWYPDFNVGGSYEVNGYSGSTPYQLNAGAVWNHIFQPEMGFELKNRLPGRYSFYGFALKPLDRLNTSRISGLLTLDFQGSKEFKWQRQAKALVMFDREVFTAGTGILLETVNDRNSVIVMFSGGLKLPFEGSALQLNCNYSLPVNGVGYSTLGTIEFGVVFFTRKYHLACTQARMEKKPCDPDKGEVPKI